MKNNKINKRRLLLLILLVIAIALITTGGYILLTSKSANKRNPENNGSTGDNKIIQEISPEKADDLYSELTEKCTGALVWNLKQGDEVEIKDLEKSNACQNDNHYSKMIGYTYDEDSNVIIHVNVLKRVDNQLFKIDGTFVAEFNEGAINDLLEKGTTYEYIYKKTGNNYKLDKVELMEPAVENTEVQE